MKNLSPARCVAVFAQMLLGLAVLMLTSPAAMADTTTLLCRMDAAMAFTENEPTTIELNEAQGSVLIHFSELFHRANVADPGQSIGRLPTLGPVPASFGFDIISIPNPSGNFFHTYTINRLTGKFVASDDSGKYQWRWDCQPGKRQF